MTRRSEATPRSRIRRAVDLLWLRSRERAAALKATGYCCARCGAKQTSAKGRELRLEVHHRDPAARQKAVDAIIEHVLRPPVELEPLCKACHGEEHKNGV